jgi:hypothetical protein
MLSERDLFVHGLHFIPDGSAAVFYDAVSDSWNQEWYAAGTWWPYKHVLMLDTYYRRENCNNCNPRSRKAGVTLNLCFENSK